MKEQGFAALYLSVIAAAVMFTLSVTMAFITIGRIAHMNEAMHAAHAYYAAESGAEDALVRIAKGMNWENSYSMDVGEALVHVSISPLTGGARTITGEGVSSERVRNARAVHQIDVTSAQLNYGAHIGEGGLHMAHNNAEVIGNVFSNGSVTGRSPATVTDALTVAGGGNSVNDITIGGDARTYSCEEASVGGDLEHHVSGTNTCTVEGGTSSVDEEIAQEEFGITDEMIQEWKDEAEAGGTVDGGGSVHISSDRTLGPGVITGNLTIANNTTLTLQGTLHVTGSFSPGNNAVIELHEGYGDTSGVIIMGGAVEVSNNVILRGSGSSSSFLLVIGESSSLDVGNPAVEVNNNADNAILFAPNGLITISNNAHVVEILAYRLRLQAATVEYDVGLADTTFSSGPAGGWSVTRWREIP